MMLGIGGLMMAVFWLLVVSTVAWLTMKVAQGAPALGRNDPARTAKVREAQGEMSQEEFQRLRQDRK